MLKLSNSDPNAKLKVVKIFNYMYKFSLERLQHFLNNESLYLLLCEYMPGGCLEALLAQCLRDGRAPTWLWGVGAL